MCYPELISVQRLFGKAKEYADDKVQLAIQTYELVDKHIRRLDSDLARFESEIKNGTVNIGPAGSVATLMSPRLASASALAAAEAAEAADKANKSKPHLDSVLFVSLVNWVAKPRH